jgi:glucokinase
MTKNKDPGTAAVIGVDVGGTKLSAALFSEEGEIIDKKRSLLEGKGGPKVGSLVAHHVKELVRYADNERYRIDSVGICVPGISNKIDGTVWAPNIPGWEAYPLYQEIKDGLDNPAIQVNIESDRNCYILGEIWKGSARGCSNAIFVAIGTGIGIGIVADGHIINGMNGIAGAIGWMALDRPYLEVYDQCGQFEFYASGTGIARRAGKGTAREVFMAYGQDDQVAAEVLDQCIQYWGMAVANLVSIFNPEKIIFGGGVFGPAIQFLDRIAEEAGKWAQPISMQQVKLEGSLLKGEAGMTGAACLALKKNTAMF